MPILSLVKVRDFAHHIFLISNVTDLLDDSSRYSELNRILLECEAPLKRLSNQLQGIQDNLTGEELDSS